MQERVSSQTPGRQLFQGGKDQQPKATERLVWMEDENRPRGRNDGGGFGENRVRAVVGLKADGCEFREEQERHRESRQLSQ